MQLVLSPSESPLRIVPPDPVTVEEFMRISAENGDLRWELEPNGDMIVMTPVRGSGGYLNSRIIGSLASWAEEDGTGFALDSSTACLLLDGAVRSPDAGWISAGRWTPPPPGDNSLVPCPDFVIELRSSTDRLKTLRDKMETWIANGAQLAWMIDPQRKAVEIYRPGSAPEIQEAHTAAYGEGAVGGFILELGRIWGP
jgi:Uma2 family endonuclease